MLTDKIIKAVHEDIPKINSQLEQIKNENLRIFKPIFGFNALGSACNDCKTFEAQKTMLNDMKYIGITEIPYCVHIEEDSSGNMTLREDLDIISKSIQYCFSNEINIPIIHVYVNQEFSTISSNFNEQYKNMIIKILDLFSVVNYKYFIVWNEATTRLRQTVVKNTVIECIDLIKSKGKLAGVALQGVSPFGYIDSSIFEKSDFICFNHYNYISYKHDKTTVEDGINSWLKGNLNDMINHSKNLYPDKPIIIGESGIISNWECLINPASIPKYGETYDLTGKVLEIYYTGLFECLKKSDIIGVYGWFPHDFLKYPEKMKKLCDKYIKGGN